LQKTEFGELAEPFYKGNIGSSTMPQKRNPTKTQFIITISKLLKQNVPVFLESMVHQHERDMSSWQAEWEALPEICLLISASLASSNNVLEQLTINHKQMRKNLDLTNGLIISESVMIKIGEKIGRQAAHKIINESCMEAFENDIPLLE